MIKVFDTVREYNSFVEGGLVAGDVYYVKEDESAHFQTNNIDGSLGVYDFIPGSGDSDYYLPVLVDASFTANGSYSPADYDADGFDQITIAVPSSGIVPTGTLTISSNGTYDVTNYASAAVSISAPAPSLNWQTVSTEYTYPGADVYLEMNAGTTYIFKSSAGDVVMYLQQADTDGDGDVDMDDEWFCIGRMVPNKEYYLTATNEYVNYNSEYDQSKAYIYFSYNGGDSITIQYAVLN